MDGWKWMDKDEDEGWMDKSEGWMDEDEDEGWMKMRMRDGWIRMRDGWMRIG